MAGDDDDQDKTTCALSGKVMPRGDAVSLAVMRPDMAAMILADPQHRANSWKIDDRPRRRMR
jgi:hypothetical protein